MVAILSSSHYEYSPKVIYPFVCCNVTKGNEDELYHRLQQPSVTIIDKIEKEILCRNGKQVRLCMECEWDYELTCTMMPAYLEWRNEATSQLVRYRIYSNEIVSRHAILLHFDVDEMESSCLMIDPKKHSCNLLLNHLRLEFIPL